MEYNILFNVAAYIRLSCEDGDKEESNSVGNQKKLINEYISKHNEFRTVEFYVDDGFTGTNFNRPSFIKMMDDIEDGKIDCVIVKDLSRFGRDYLDTGKYLERIFPEKGIRFISIIDGIDSMKQAYDMLIPIKNLFNEQYARDISNKIQATVKAKQNSGDFIGAFASFGYMKSPDNKNKLIIDEYAAGIVRRIFNMFIEGYGKQRIARILNDEGVPCPSEYKRMNGENYVNPKRLESTTYWSYSTVNNILKKEMYRGNMVQGTRHQELRRKQKRISRSDWIVVENTHEAIIDEDTWNKTQNLLRRRKKDIGLQDNNHVFSGFVKCADCGRSMVKNTWKRSDGTRSCIMYCSTYKSAGKKYCTPHSLPMDVLEKIVIDDLNTIIQSVSDLSVYIKTPDYAKSIENDMLERKIDKTKAELERIKKLKKSAYEDYKDDLISKDDFLSYRKDYESREDFLTKQLGDLEEKYNEGYAESILNNTWINHLLECKRIDKLDRAIITDMVHEITVYENRRIKITYNFSDELESLFSSVYEVKKTS